MPKQKNKKRSKALTASAAAVAGSPYSAHHHHSTKRPVVNLVTPNTSIGQHFLKNPAVITAILAKAAIQPTDTVLEIGPGTGNMTVPLLQQAKRVVALEYDSRMIRELLKRTEQSSAEQKSKLQIIQGDAMKTSWPFFNVLVANLPYQISSPVTFKLLQHRPMFRCAVLMFQEEFALRLTARPGEALYCRLSVNTQLLAKVDQLLKVKKENFRPPPKVESRVVRIELKNPPPPVNFTEWDGMIRLLFNRKNKTLRAVLTTKSVLKMLDDNRKTVRALQQQQQQQQQKQQQRKQRKVNHDGMDCVVEQTNTDSSSDVHDRPVKDVVEEILQQEAWQGQRASKLDLDDFLQLLATFNQAGFHFC